MPSGFWPQTAESRELVSFSSRQGKENKELLYRNRRGGTPVHGTGKTAHLNALIRSAGAICTESSAKIIA
jgi:hypothetical protein